MILQPNKFKYMFTALFEDGSSYEQTLDDKATIADKGSCFSDVLELQKTKTLIAFELACDEHIVSLDLKTGYFRINGVKTFLNPSFEGIFISPLKLVYFRRNTVDIQMNAKTGEQERGRVSTVYCLGYETRIKQNSKSEKFKQIISLS